MSQGVHNSELSNSLLLYSRLSDLDIQALNDFPFVRYVLDVSYQWPTRPTEKNFIERVADGIEKRFGSSVFMNIQVFSELASLKPLTQNLRGRLLQKFEEKLMTSSDGRLPTWRNNPLLASPGDAQLHLFLHAKGIVGGLTSSRAARHHFAGGLRFLAASVSRAGAKLIEAEEHLRLFDVLLPQNGRWLEFGAAPGGMTKVLLDRGLSVDAVDRAALDADVRKNPNLRFYQVDATVFKSSERYSGIVCDMNGDALQCASTVARHSSQLTAGGVVIFTLKLASLESWKAQLESVKNIFHKAQLKVIDVCHLYHNRSELTVLLTKE